MKVAQICQFADLSINCYLRTCYSCVFQTDEQEVINFLLTTEIIPLCLKIMESGSELSKTVTFICFDDAEELFYY